MLNDSDLTHIRPFSPHGDNTPSPGERLILMRAGFAVTEDTVSTLRFVVEEFEKLLEDAKSERHQESYEEGHADGYNEGYGIAKREYE